MNRCAVRLKLIRVGAISDKFKWIGAATGLKNWNIAMSRARKIAHQWLAADEAMGAMDVPIVRRADAGLGGKGMGIKSPEVVRTESEPQFLLSISRPATGHPVETKRTVEPAAPRREVVRGTPVPEAELPPVPPGAISDEPHLTRAEKGRRLSALADEAHHVLAAYLSDVAQRVVFGEGDPGAKLMFIGEGPGQEEDRTGRPFVGRAGQLLDKMIAAMGFTREIVYIANICKLRAASFDDETKRLRDRPPTTSEVALGLPWLHRQIAIIQPQVIVTLGLPATRYVVGVTESMRTLRGRWHEYRGIAVMPTYHPAYLLRAYTPENRGAVWGDLQAVVKRLKEMDESNVPPPGQTPAAP